jgi:predicted Mrr-cat superfamily restriction endonuclease
MRVWRLITHHADKDHALFWTKQNSRVAIGWGAIGDIRKKGYESADDITSAIKIAYPGLDNSHLGGASLWDFHREIQNGDLVVLSATKPRVLVAEVDGDYEWLEDSPFEGDYQHQRHVIIRRDLSPEDVWQKAGGAARQNVHQTLIKCERTLTEDDL